MCSIIGFSGNEIAAPIIVKGLKRMEYRGYGSSHPVIDDKTISLLSNEEEIKKAHQTNRRTIYKIIK